jgi:hypothetical protein
MKKLVFIGLALVLAITLGAGLGLAGDNIPSTKAAFYWDYVDVVYPEDPTDPGTPLGWQTIYPDDAIQIKTGTPKDLIITVSAECVLATTARLVGDDENALSDSSDAEIRIRVKIVNDDGSVQWACPPGGVDNDGITFAWRLTELRGQLSGQYECDDLGTPELEMCPDWIELFMHTATANSFCFVAEDVGSGIHEIVVEASLNASGPTTKNPKNDYDPEWFAMIGHASVVVDEVNLKSLPTTT